MSLIVVTWVSRSGNAALQNAHVLLPFMYHSASHILCTLFPQHPIVTACITRHESMQMEHSSVSSFSSVAKRSQNVHMSPSSWMNRSPHGQIEMPSTSLIRAQNSFTSSSLLERLSISKLATRNSSSLAGLLNPAASA
ncbi:hypothetical protein ATCV1_z293R [Acanthocystis turfacea chlorella virus 1]|uniref:Uncharacterized protein z293R n=1 Tax=Chlorovirus heliozoae TaxID=322019 RepID=A7K8Q3_9PHYC|nr:hypothetical protein ATCV1_z293R [Acanthocystis turfacea chlorella virus 1]ABT16427.1 hypothetical protein ATCV1_z293R [Acanthocystis turfacea chlorella virus 1]